MSVRASIVIPNLDCPLVGETLAALARDGLPDAEHEVIVVGRDAPRAVPRDGSVRFIESETELNPAAARNLGVEAASGERLLFTDADCQPAAGWAEYLDRALDEVPVAGGAVTFDLGANVWALADNIASFSELLSDRAPHRQQPFLGTLNMAIRRDAWERVGPFDVDLPTSEDVDWTLRARKLDLATRFVPAAVVRHAAVRDGRDKLVAHATWYGRSFHVFRAQHPGVFDRGWAWRRRRRLLALALPKALSGAARTFLDHPRLLRECWRAAPGVLLFKLAWYRAVLASWPGSDLRQ